jgi:ribosome-associated protein
MFWWHRMPVSQPGMTCTVRLQSCMRTEPFMRAIPRPKRRPAPPPETQIVVRGDHITLGQLLKAADIIGTGGEAKFYLAETVVSVNGEPEQRRGRKLRPGDLIVFPDAPPVLLVAPPEDTDVRLPDPIETEATASRPKNKPSGDIRTVSPTTHETHLEHRQKHPQDELQENPR